MAEAASYTVVRIGGVTQITVPSGTDYYYWFLDGVFWARTTTPVLLVALAAGDEAEIFCECNDDADWDYVANAPAAYPARRTIWWTAAADAARYLAQYATGESEPAGEAYVTIADVRDDGSWTYRIVTPRLDDLTWYWFRVVPYDAAGNAGTALVAFREYVVRTPDAPDVTVTYSSGTQRVTFAEAS